MDRMQMIVDAKQRGFNCAQAVLGAYAAEYHLDEQAILRMTSVLGGGLARQGETCGAVTGALMALGLQSGTSEPDDPDAKDQAYELGERFMAEFCRRNGTTLCRDLLGCDISTPEGLQFAREHTLFDKFCRNYVYSAAEILVEMEASR